MENSKYFSNKEISSIKNLMLLEKEVSITSYRIEKTSILKNGSILGILFIFVFSLIYYLNAKIHMFIYFENNNTSAAFLSSLNFAIPISITIVLLTAFVLQKKIDSLINKKLSILNAINKLFA